MLKTLEGLSSCSTNQEILWFLASTEWRGALCSQMDLLNPAVRPANLVSRPLCCSSVPAAFVVVVFRPRPEQPVRPCSGVLGWNRLVRQRPIPVES